MNIYIYINLNILFVVAFRPHPHPPLVAKGTTLLGFLIPATHLRSGKSGQCRVEFELPS